MVFNEFAYQEELQLLSNLNGNILTIDGSLCKPEILFKFFLTYFASLDQCSSEKRKHLFSNGIKIHETQRKTSKLSRFALH